MRKRKFVCGMLALCLALSVAGCGKSSEEKQVANYYQQELGLDKDEAEELAHELYGEDEEEEEPSVSEEAPREIVIEPLPELLNSEWYDRKIQILDMAFDNDWTMTDEALRKIVAGSAYDVEIEEGFDENGNVCIKGFTVNGMGFTRDGKIVMGDAEYHVKVTFDTTFDHPNAFDRKVTESYGWVNDELCYHIRTDYFPDYAKYWYTKPCIEFADLKTRDDVLAYLSENGFIEVEKEQASYSNYTLHEPLYSDKISVEYLDTPHYYCQGVQRIHFYRMHKLDETDREIEDWIYTYSGARLYLLNSVYYDFNTDGTISTWGERTSEVVVLGEEK